MNKISLFTLFALVCLSLGWLAVILAIAGFFYLPLFLIFIFGGIVFFIYQLAKNKDLIKINKEFWAAGASAIIFICAFSYFTTPTIFSGRDQGALSEAAVRLAQNHQLEFSTPASEEFFKIYGPGKALNFPGFNYTKTGLLVSQFPIGYISWLAAFYSLFGLNGFVVANSITFFIFILSFYFLAKEILPGRSAYVALGLALTSFVFSWFFKFTLSENLALALLWFGIWQFYLFFKNSSKLNFLFFILSFGSLLFVRIEAWAFLFVALAILWIKHKKNTLPMIGKKNAGLLIMIILIYVLGIIHNTAPFLEPIKGFLKPLLAQPASSGNTASENGNFFQILWNYGLLEYVFFGIMGFLLMLKSKKINLAIPFLIVLPSFIYLIEPNISGDHPWMLRRFVFSIIPISILYTVYLIELVLSKWRIVRYLTIFFFLIINLSIFIPYLPYSPHKNLLTQTEKMSQNFGSNDLVLIDRLATGDGWSMITGPMNFLFGKQTAYFFNLDNLAKMDLEKFSNVYFIIPDFNFDFYQPISSRLVPIENYTITNNFLISTGDFLPVFQNLETAGKIYLLK